MLLLFQPALLLQLFALVGFEVLLARLTQRLLTYRLLPAHLLALVGIRCENIDGVVYH